MLWWLVLGLSLWIGSGVIVLAVVWSLVVRSGRPDQLGIPGRMRPGDPGTQAQHAVTESEAAA